MSYEILTHFARKKCKLNVGLLIADVIKKFLKTIFKTECDISPYFVRCLSGRLELRLLTSLINI